MQSLEPDSAHEWARNSITGELCKPKVPLHPFNYVESYSAEVKRVQALLKCSASFAFLRENDGERDAILGDMNVKKTFKDRGKAGEKWQASAGAPQQLSKDVTATMQVVDRRYLLGLAVPTCVEGLRNEFRSGGGNVRVLMFFSRKHDNGTLQYKPPFHSWSYSNLFTHRGGMRSISFMTRIINKPDTYVVTNENVKQLALDKGFSWARRIITFPMKLPQMWEGKVRLDALKKARMLAGSKKGSTFVFALGTIAKIFIHNMWLENSNNSYVDIGSLLEGVLGNMKARAWLAHKCHRIGSSCTEATYVAKHDMLPCARRDCQPPLVPMLTGHKSFKFDCRNRGTRG
eukprot:gene8634-10246_t